MKANDSKSQFLPITLTFFHDFDINGWKSMTIRPITPIVPMLSDRSYSCGSFHVLFVIQVVKKMNFLEGRLSLRKQHVQVFLGKNIDSL
jgi:hypothetical protein